MLHHWRCVLIGRESLLIQCATLLKERGHEIAAVVPQGPAVREWAKSRGIRLIGDVAELGGGEAGGFDYLFSVTNLEILPEDIIALPHRAAINFHDGPLPDYAGLNTPVWALLNGEREHGVTWHLMTKGIDRGPVLASRAFPIDEEETAFSLNAKCFAAGIESFEELIDAMAAGRAVPVPQPDGERRLYGRRDRPFAAGAIRWDLPEEEIARLVRGLDFGGYANPVGMAKTSCNGALMLVQSVRVDERTSSATPGTILRLGQDGIAVATGGKDILLSRICLPGGLALTPEEAAIRYSLLPGMCFDLLPDGDLATLDEMGSALAAHESYWLDRLRSMEPLEAPLARTGAAPSGETAWLDFPLDAPNAKSALAAALAYFGRIADRPRFDIGYDEPILTLRYDGLEDWFSPQVPLRTELDFSSGFTALRDQLEQELREIHRRIGYWADLPARTPELRQNEQSARLPVAVTIADRIDPTASRRDADLVLLIRADASRCRWLYDPARFDSAAIELMQEGLSNLLAAACADPEQPIGTLPLQEHATLCSGPALPWKNVCIHQMFSQQAARTPDQIAVTCQGESLSYGELDARSNQFARHLQSLGVGPDMLVGLFMERSTDLVVALFGILKAGGAYVPLDPRYPAERIHYMLKDSGASVVVTQAGIAARLAATSARLVCMDSDRGAIEAYPRAAIESAAMPHNLAYVIYTSGSTGKPKGVMVEHRNVANFFAGMDQRIAAPGTWLAVTSLSFDISVLELFWTLARGFHVVLATGEAFAHAAPAAGRPLDFSLFYFAADAESEPGERYRLLLEGAKFADANGFAAVWTPERHFHDFGGLYPNPAVTGAALAAITSRVAIRGGSVVMPLHHPARVAEEWAVVDNLSNGRAGIAFASGWQPNDFVLRPQSYADRNGALMQGAEAVRSLWRGEPRYFDGPLGEQVEIRTLPRPVQAELPVWITSAGNVETFAAAGRAGAGVLTHLLGQTIEELAHKLSAYRAARKEAGHPGDGHVVLMLHTFVGPDAEKVRAAVREPMIAYLRTATNLVKQYAWSFPAFKRRPGMEQTAGEPDLTGLSDAEMDMLLDHAFNRYFETSGLFGTPQSCLEMVQRAQAVGVDEIACLIDFGVDAGEVLAHLPHLDALRRLSAPVADETEGESLPALMARHGVTHLQCTPSMIRLLLADSEAREPLSRLRHLMVGGEAFPKPLAGELHQLVGGTVTNMYGPTETTIWSTTHDLDGTPGVVPVGRPLANQQIYVLDSRRQPFPNGVPGEIVIGGAGVVRGYLHRPELTAERFIADPLIAGARAYRTGDLGRIRPDGLVEILGRLDHQVKIRGYRIELGEIEAALASHSAVGEAVVIPWEEEAGDVRLAAYVTPVQATEVLQDIRAFVQARLPEFMVPAYILSLARLPQTPNGKIDRKALPAPQLSEASMRQAYMPPANDVERRIADIWRDVLKLDQIGSRDNFFDIGGHSLLAVQMHRRIRSALSIDLPITDIFRFPTVESLSAHLSGTGESGLAAQEGQARAQERRLALRRRAGARAPVALSEGS